MAPEDKDEDDAPDDSGAPTEAQDATVDVEADTIAAEQNESVDADDNGDVAADVEADAHAAGDADGGERPSGDPAASASLASAASLSMEIEDVIPSNPSSPFFFLRKIDRFIGQVEFVFLVLAMTTLVIVALLQGLMSFSGNPPHIFTELIRATVLALAIVGGAYAAHHDRQISMDVISNRLGGVGGTLVLQFVRILVIIICLVSATYAWSIQFAGSQADVLPQDKVVKLLPIGLALIALHLVFHILSDIMILADGKVPGKKRSAH